MATLCIAGYGGSRIESAAKSDLGAEEAHSADPLLRSQELRPKSRVSRVLTRQDRENGIGVSCCLFFLSDLSDFRLSRSKSEKRAVGYQPDRSDTGLPLFLGIAGLRKNAAGDPAFVVRIKNISTAPNPRPTPSRGSGKSPSPAEVVLAQPLSQSSQVNPHES